MSDNIVFSAEEITTEAPKSRMTDEYIAFINNQMCKKALADAALMRHSVRSYLDKEIESDKATLLNAAVDEINTANGFSFKLFLNEPEAFKDGKGADYGQFSNCKNYLALIAPKHMDEKVGYFGEKLVLMAQLLGLNTCWVALTYRKSQVNADIKDGDKLYLVIALGYGETQGKPHVSKNAESHYTVKTESTPSWFLDAMSSALFAPTAINQQKYHFTLLPDGKVKARAKLGPYTKIDLGIVKYHFELGAGDHEVEYAD